MCAKKNMFLQLSHSNKILRIKICQGSSLERSLYKTNMGSLLCWGRGGKLREGGGKFKNLNKRINCQVLKKYKIAIVNYFIIIDIIHNTLIFIINVILLKTGKV